MKTKFPITNKFKTITPANVSPDRYRYMQPGEEEPNLGLPSDNGYVLTSTISGTRSWVPATPAPSPGVNQQVIFNNNGVLAGTGDLYYNPTTNRLSLGSVNSTAKLEITETWNNSSTTFVAFKENITDTSSSNQSLLADLQVNSVSKFKVSKSGVVTATEFVGNLIGNSTTTSALATPVFINFEGEVVGSVEFDGSSSVTVETNPTIRVFSKSLTLTDSWIDVGISGTDLDTGTYVMQVFASDIAVGGKNLNEYYSGIVTWYAGETNSVISMPSDEIVLHRSGGSSETSLYLRTYRSTAPNVIKLQMLSTTVNSSSSTYTFKFRKFI